MRYFILLFTLVVSFSSAIEKDHHIYLYHTKPNQNIYENIVKIGMIGTAGGIGSVIGLVTGIITIAIFDDDEDNLLSTFVGMAVGAGAGGFTGAIVGHLIAHEIIDNFSNKYNPTELEMKNLYAEKNTEEDLKNI